MLFKPFGVKSDGVVDPDVLGNEVQEASRVVNETTWWQWADAAFTDSQVLADSTSTKDDGAVRTERDGETVQMGTNETTRPVLVTSSTTSTPDTDLFQIPYNLGSIEIDDTSVSWTSRYSELLFVAFSFQYVREVLDEMFTSADLHRIRTQIRLRISGHPVSVGGT